MKGYVTVEEMRALEANSDYFGVSYGELMENAGKSVAEAIIAMHTKGSVLVVCGTGNNGGDGFVAARYLHEAGYRVLVVLLGETASIKPGISSVNLERLKSIGVEVREITVAEKLSADIFEAYDIIVDAILGTGVIGIPREPARTAIGLINHSHAYKVSVDIPSGLDVSTGGCTVHVRPDLVVTFHAMKKGLDGYNVRVADIGIPKKAVNYAGPGDLLGIRTRGDFLYKGESGKVLVIGGGPYTGAPALTALAALRTGADIVTVAAPGRAADIIASFAPDLIVRPTTDMDKLVEEDVRELVPLIRKNDIVVIGMGLGNDPSTMAAVKKIIMLCEKVVIDADALKPGIPLKGIITPHRGEFMRIGGGELKPGDEETGNIVKDFASKKGVITLLKGKVDVISDGERIKYNSTGNAGMTVGGTGDVLAGIVGAMYCRNPAFEAACAAAFISGAAGDMAFEDKGYGLIASDVVSMIPYAVRKYRHRK